MTPRTTQRRRRVEVADEVVREALGHALARYRALELMSEKDLQADRRHKRDEVALNYLVRLAQHAPLTHGGRGK